jgi:hypothetical protein
MVSFAHSGMNREGFLGRTPVGSEACELSQGLVADHRGPPLCSQGPLVELRVVS